MQAWRASAARRQNKKSRAMESRVDQTPGADGVARNPAAFFEAFNVKILIGFSIFPCRFPRWKWRSLACSSNCKMSETSPNLARLDDPVALAEYAFFRELHCAAASALATCAANNSAADIDPRLQANPGVSESNITPAANLRPVSNGFAISPTKYARFKACSREFGETAPLMKADKLCPMPLPDGSNLNVLLLILIVLAALALGSGLASNPVAPTSGQAAIEETLTRQNNLSVEMLVDRILLNESQGDPVARNKRSSAMGAGQFVDETWLELMRAHHRDLLAGLTEKEALELRSDQKLSREMTRHFIERNAIALARRGLPVTPSSLYLAHFAGPAGATAILTSPGDADAATVIANADSRPEVTRAKIINGNPFLRGFTVEDLKNWAELKMAGLAAR
jgi:hypothetical protein